MTFAPIVIDENKFGPGWDQTRGAIARAAIALFRFDDESLEMAATRVWCAASRCAEQG